MPGTKYEGWVTRTPRESLQKLKRYGERIMTERRTIEIVSGDSNLESSPWHIQEKDADGRPIGERLIPYDTSLHFKADEFIVESQSSWFLKTGVLSEWSDVSKRSTKIPLLSDLTEKDSGSFDFSLTDVVVIPLKGSGLNAVVNFHDGRLFSSYRLEIRPIDRHPVAYCMAEVNDAGNYSVVFQLFVPSVSFYEFRSLLLNRTDCKLTIAVQGLGGVYHTAGIAPKPYQALIFAPQRLQVDGYESIQRRFPEMDYFSLFFGNPSSVIRWISIRVCCAPDINFSPFFVATAD